MKDVLEKLQRGEDLSPQEAEGAMRIIMSGKATHEQTVSFLRLLRDKGETIDEIAAFTRVLRDFSIKVKPNVSKPMVDTCGAGGDKLNTFNISTTSAFVVAGAGVPVAKHGNRAVSSKSGSADVLKELGVNIEAGPKKAKECIEKAGIGFMFAPLHHSAMKNVALARKELATRTVFNILGPLISPAEVKHQVYGVYDPSLTEKLAGVLKELGSTHALVIHGMHGLDEFSTLGGTKVSELKDGEITTYVVNPKQFNTTVAKEEDISGGGPEENAQITRSILGGEKGPRRDIVVLNAGAAIYVADAAKTLAEGILMAGKSIDSGKAMKALDELIRISNS